MSNAMAHARECPAVFCFTRSSETSPTVTFQPSFSAWSSMYLIRHEAERPAPMMRIFCISVFRICCEDRNLIGDGRCKMQDARCKMQDARFKMQDARFKIQDARFKMQDARCKIQDSRFKM